MNRINKLFEEKKGDILSVYFTAGYPELNDTAEIICQLEKQGADLIEVGIPFSDPLADGPTIQASDEQALRNGMNMNLLFEQLKDIRSQVQIPLILMGYLNPVMQYGMENFLRKCGETGIDGTILPDLPYDEYINEYESFYTENNLHNIFLITPQTSADRVRAIDQASRAFIYMVAAYAITGTRQGFEAYQEEYFKRIAGMGLKNPRLIGFGISGRESFRKACGYANGAIIGSAFIKALKGEGSIEEKVGTFVKSLK